MDHSYLQRFKLDPAYLIPDAELRDRYRSVVARHFPWREALIDLDLKQRGGVDEAFALDAARLISRSPIPMRLRLEARLALFLSASPIGRVIGTAIPRKRRDGQASGRRRSPANVSSGH